MGGPVGLYMYNTSLSNTIWLLIVFPIVLILVVSMFLTLMFLMVYKIIMVHKSTENALGPEARQRTISSITKISLLSFTSIISTILFVVILTVRPSMGTSIHYDFILALFGVTDPFTNFLSIVLGFGRFRNQYIKICGCCDAKCKSLCNKMVKGQHQEMELSNHSKIVESQSTATDTV